MAYPLQHAQIGWSAVHDFPSVLCLRSGWGSGSPSFAHLCAWSTILPALAFLLQGVDSSRCRGSCLPMQACSCPMCLCTVYRIDRNPSADSWFVCVAPTSMGSSSITWCSFFPSVPFSRATSVAVLRILACTALNRWPAKALSVNPFRKLTTLPSSPMLWGRRAWLQIRIAGCMPWCFLLASVWSNVAFSVSPNLYC